jgi:porphyrinogen peroxidase
MLQNMFQGSSPATHDRILDFSTAVTGTLFFAPTVDFLDDLPDPPGAGGAAGADEPEREPETAPGMPAPDGSLGIGDLKRSTDR